jgi:hypothetical protein
MSKDLERVDFNTQWWVRHNMDTFSGRFLHWWYVANPLNGLTFYSTLRTM